MSVWLCPCVVGQLGLGELPYNLAKVGLTLVMIFLNFANHRRLCLNCGEFAFFAPSCWLGCLNFALAPIRLCQIIRYWVVPLTWVFAGY